MSKIFRVHFNHLFKFCFDVFNMIIFMNSFLLFGRMYTNLVSSVWNYTVTPFLSFALIFTSRFLSTIFGDVVCVWTVANYADAYWFLYSNKRIIYELRYSK